MDYDYCPSSSSLSSSDDQLVQSSSHSLVPSPKRKAGRKKFKETRHPVYRGVRERNGGRWVCEVREPNKKTRIWLGTYPTPEMAARAHDVAAIALRGKSALLNFEDSAWMLPRAKENHQAIRRIAYEAAEMFRPIGSPPTRIKRLSPSRYASCVEEMVFVKQPPPPVVVFVDEEAVFNMPGLLMEMAEGLMLTPPVSFDWDAGECCASHIDTMSLWSN